MFKIAVHPCYVFPGEDRAQTFSSRWVQGIEERGHEAKIVDAFGEDFFGQIRGCDGFMWWFPPISIMRNLGRKLMFSLSHVSNVVPFPDWKACWHFDDKVAQTYLLEAAEIPTPKTRVFWKREQAMEFCSRAKYPIVIKLSSGVYSKNVALLHDRKDAEFQIQRLFNRGQSTVETRPRTVLALARRKARRAANSVRRTRTHEYLERDIHRDYILLQEFVPDNDFDTRITIIGNRAFGFRRGNRPHDFRASGSGQIDGNPELIAEDAIRLAFRAAQILKTPSLCVDVLRQNGKPVLNEISYFYPSFAINVLEGHWNLEGDAETGILSWNEGTVRAEDVLLEDFLGALKSRKSN